MAGAFPYCDHFIQEHSIQAWCSSAFLTSGLHSSLFHLPHFLRLPWTSRLHVARSSLRLQPHQQPPTWQASSGYPGLCGSVTAQASPEEPLCCSVLRPLLHISCQHIQPDPWKFSPSYWLFLPFVASATYISLVWGAFCFLPLIWP